MLHALHANQLLQRLLHECSEAISCTDISLAYRSTRKPDCRSADKDSRTKRTSKLDLRSIAYAYRMFILNCSSRLIYKPQA